MSETKEKAIELIRALPDEVTFEDIQYHLYVCQKIDRGLRDIEQNDLVAQAEVEQKVEEWLKSYGREPR